MPPTSPGTSAVVFVTFAAMGGIPNAMSTGNVIRVPPPAMAFTKPAKSAAISDIKRVKKSISALIINVRNFDILF